MRCESLLNTRFLSLDIFTYLLFFFKRYQDIHNQSHIMVMAGGRWLGVRLDVIISLLIGTVALAAVLASQDAGKYNHYRSVSYYYKRKKESL